MEGWRFHFLRLNDESSSVICCPRCGNVLSEKAKSDLACSYCGRGYSVHLGIPDLRWPLPSSDSPSSLAKDLIRAYTDSTFAELVAMEMEALTSPSQLHATYSQYRATVISRGGRLEQKFQENLYDHFSGVGTSNAMNLGCGSGAGLADMAERFMGVWGVDPFLPDLILARKLCDELGLTNVQLVQAFGQQLPFVDSTFDYVSAQNVVEHLGDAIDDVLTEVRRVLRPEGCFCADSRNRFDLFGREPHVQLRFVGFLPRSLMPWYVHLFRQMEYKGIYLLSLTELRRSLTVAFGSHWKIVLPRPSTYGYPAYFDRIFAALQKVPALHHLLKVGYPSYFAIAQFVPDEVLHV